MWNGLSHYDCVLTGMIVELASYPLQSIAMVSMSDEPQTVDILLVSITLHALCFVTHRCPCIAKEQFSYLPRVEWLRKALVCSEYHQDWLWRTWKGSLKFTCEMLDCFWVRCVFGLCALIHHAYFKVSIQWIVFFSSPCDVAVGYAGYKILIKCFIQLVQFVCQETVDPLAQTYWNLDRTIGSQEPSSGTPASPRSTGGFLGVVFVIGFIACVRRARARNMAIAGDGDAGTVSGPFRYFRWKR